jgi:hypothetical protein
LKLVLINYARVETCRVCQKEDWRKHKRYCGKEKVVKKLQGTAQDPFWAFPDIPEHLRFPVDVDPNGNVAITSIGFGNPHPSNPHSPALQRQVSLINGDKEADYFLFDDLERPIRFSISDMWTKMAFRILRSDAMFSADRKGLEAIAEHLIKCMGQRPGLSRERILAQFNREYGEGTAEKVAEFETKGEKNGYEKGVTFVEVMGKGMPGMPAMMDRLAKR